MQRLSSVRQIGHGTVGLKLMDARNLHQGIQGTVLRDQIDGAHIRCQPEYQRRPPFVVVGKIESPNMNRRFGLVPQAAYSLARQLRQALVLQRSDSQRPAGVISDDEPALVNLVHRTVQGGFSTRYSGLVVCFHARPAFQERRKRFVSGRDLSRDIEALQASGGNATMALVARKYPDGRSVAGLLPISCEQHGQPDRLWLVEPKRLSGFFVPGRGLYGRYRQHLHENTPMGAMVPQRRSPGCSHKSGCSRQSALKATAPSGPTALF